MHRCIDLYNKIHKSLYTSKEGYFKRPKIKLHVILILCRILIFIKSKAYKNEVIKIFFKLPQI